MRSSWLLYLILSALPISLLAGAEGDTSPDFNFDIKPLLSDRCFVCHGPDGTNREADLRLDTRVGLFSEAQYGVGTQIVSPGVPEESALYLRLVSNDDDSRMPPADSHLAVTAGEVERIRRWIASGATWQEHWSLLPIRRPDVPRVDGSADLHPIDAFVRRRQADLGWQPTAEAPRERLIRRVTLDLTGLPPTVAEVDAFLADRSDEAYERLVDRLLASPRFGERMAVEWLDLARYADTYGYQADRYRAVWQWRDWVVGAFNRNLPYDQFLVWQLAGDLLPQPTREQVLATAFNRLHRQTNEGGSLEEEFRNEYVVDRVDTFGTALLGLTVQCARCHDHKYDPITHREYYQLAAFFNSIDECGLYSHFTDAVPTPTLELSTAAEQAQQQQLRQQIADGEERVKQVGERQRDAFQKWLTRMPPTPDRLPGLIAHFFCDEMVDGELPNDVDEQTGGRVIDELQLIAGPRGNAVLLNGENGFATLAGGSYARHDPFSIAAWIYVPESLPERAVVWHRSRAWTDAGSRGYQLLLENHRLSASLIHFWPGNAMRVVTDRVLPTETWLHVAVTYDGSSRASGLRLYLDGRSASVEVVRDGLTRTVQYASQDEGGDVDSPVRLTIGRRFRDRGFAGGRLDELQVFDRDLTPVEVAALTDPQVLRENLRDGTDAAYEYYLANHDATYGAAVAELRNVRRQYNSLCDSVGEIMVMREMSAPRPTYRLERGAYDAPADRVTRNTPVSLPPFDANLPRDRLGLARWLVDPQHPLPARVVVNRYWQMLLGRGLVVTSEDFGSQGQLPSHPQLLDWLAASFVESGWDVKWLLRQIVLSRTYRQDSVCTPEARQADPENRWLARGPQRRLPAEMIRDAALHASGLLVADLGGPPVKPYQPPGLWKEKGSETYERDAGDGSHRRSLYTFWKRTSPPPAMMTLDAAKRDVCVARRPSTATPLQALVLLNDPQYVEAARALAERALLLPAADDPQRLTWLFRALTSRQPQRDELVLLDQLWREQTKYFTEHQLAASALLAVGDHLADSRLAPDKLAAMTMVAQATMNLSAFVMQQ